MLNPWYPRLTVYPLLLAVAFVLLWLTGCAGFGQPSYGADMSAAQITAAAKDKSAAVVCTRLIGAGYTLETTTISLDQRAIQDGGIVVDGTKGCTATITTVAPPHVPPK